MDRAGKQFHFKFLGKEALAANFRQRLVEDFIALGGDDLLFAFKIGMNVFQGTESPTGFASGQCGGTGCKNEFPWD